jgi:hypothetical protein
MKKSLIDKTIAVNYSTVDRSTAKQMSVSRMASDLKPWTHPAATESYVNQLPIIKLLSPSVNRLFDQSGFVSKTMEAPSTLEKASI